MSLCWLFIRVTGFIVDSGKITTVLRCIGLSLYFNHINVHGSPRLIISNLVYYPSVIVLIGNQISVCGRSCCGPESVSLLVLQNLLLDRDKTAVVATCINQLARLYLGMTMSD